MNCPEGAVPNFLEPSHDPAFMRAAMSLAPADSAFASMADDVALGCECADPALQIAMWGQEVGESCSAAISA